jgi:hypothetical protein
MEVESNISATGSKPEEVMETLMHWSKLGWEFKGWVSDVPNEAGTKWMILQRPKPPTQSPFDNVPI